MALVVDVGIYFLPFLKILSMAYVFLYSAILFNVLTNIGFKLSALNEGAPARFWGYFAGGLVFGLANSYLFTECLKGIKLSEASAVFFSLTILGLFLVSHFMFKEAFTVKSILGGVLIIGGVVLVSMK